MNARALGAAMLTLVLAGCSESPQQRATRISHECAAIAEEVGRTRERGLSDNAKLNMIGQCIYERGKGGSR